jgi:hypothetical protein
VPVLANGQVIAHISLSSTDFCKGRCYHRY